MTATTKFSLPTPVPTEAEPQPPANPLTAGLADWLREQIWTGSATAKRSLQRAAGMSEIGTECERQLAYKILGIPPANFQGDPMPSLVGTGLHHVLAEIFTRADAGTGRWLIEQPVSYRGVPGSADAYDRRRRLLIDWKSTAKGKLRGIRNDGPPMRYIVQTQLYGQALREAGEDPQALALVYLARDGALSDLHVWTATPDKAVADEWVDRYERIRLDVTAHNSPGDVSAKPSRLCGWCDHYAPNATDLRRGCPGQNL